MDRISADLSQTSVDLISEMVKRQTRDFGSSLPYGIQSESAPVTSVGGANQKDVLTGHTSDTVTISQEGRDKANQSVTGKFTLPSTEEGEASATNPKEDLLRQIKEIQEKIQDAQSRLAEAQGNSQSENKKNNEGSSLDRVPDVITDESAEVKTIQAEIELLSQQLLMFNDQLMEMTSGSSGGGGGGTRAGIGGASNGPSGQGQRIQVQA